MKPLTQLNLYIVSELDGLSLMEVDYLVIPYLHDEKLWMVYIMMLKTKSIYVYHSSNERLDVTIEENMMILLNFYISFFMSQEDREPDDELNKGWRFFLSQ